MNPIKIVEIEQHRAAILDLVRAGEARENIAVNSIMKSLSITVLLGLCSTLPWPPLATASAITRSSEIHSNRAQWEVEFGATGATVTRYLRASVHHEPRRLVEPIVEGFELGMDLEAYAKDINSPPLKECILLFGAFCNGETTTRHYPLVADR